MKKEKLKKIKKLRKFIDSIDRKIIDFLDKRIKTALTILEIKAETGLSLRQQKREREIINNLIKASKNKILKEYLPTLYEIIFSMGKEFYKLRRGEVKFKKIGIIGSGLIGGSIIKALKLKDDFLEIYGLKNEDKEAKIAYNQGYLNNLISLEELTFQSELIIISTPIETIEKIAEKISKTFKSKKYLLVIDVGSIKEKIVKTFEKLTNRNIEFLGTHPMAGSHKSGFLNSSPNLFLNHPWIITPHSKNKKESILKIKGLIKGIGSRPAILSATEHDKIVAKVSHLIFLVSKIIFLYVYQTNKDWFKYGGSGLKNITRLTGANPHLHYQILKNNSRNIEDEFKKFLKFINQISPKQFSSLKKLKNLKDLYEKFFLG